MSDQQYMSWFRQVVGMGWVCGLFQPPEILANYVLHYLPVMPYNDPVPYEHMERFMIEYATYSQLKTNMVSLEEAIAFFNAFYPDGRFRFEDCVGQRLPHGTA